MEYINCILCNEDNTKNVFTGRDLRYNTSKETFNIVMCKRCGLVYVNPRPTKEEIGEYYPDNYRPRETLKSVDRVRKRMKKYKTKRRALFFKNPWFIDLPVGTTVLDIGCGAGELLLRLRELGCNAYGIDVDDTQNLHETMNINVSICDIDNGTSFDSDFFDVIIMRHSLEHVHNPVNALQEVRRIMRPDGVLVVGVPNIESCVSKITGENWGDLDIPRHLYHFNQSTISALLNKVCFSVENIHHEFKVSRRSLKRWMVATSMPSFLLPRILTNSLGGIFSILHKSEWIVVKSRKKDAVK